MNIDLGIDKNGKKMHVGDIVKMTRRVRTGTTRSKRHRRRGYVTYAVESNLTFTGVLKVGPWKDIKHYVCVAYVETESKSTYPSYFWAQGLVSDRPEDFTESHSEIIDSRNEYEVIGKISKNPELLSTPPKNMQEAGKDK